MARKPDIEPDELTKNIQSLFDSALGHDVLDGLLDAFVYVENPTADGFIEGQRSLVLMIRETINYKP